MYPDDTDLPSSPPPLWLLILIAAVALGALYWIAQL